jgi:hypothetical protein
VGILVEDGIWIDERMIVNLDSYLRILGGWLSSKGRAVLCLKGCSLP